MSHKIYSTCRKCSLLAFFLLLLHIASAQSRSNFNKVEDWLKLNLTELGGRAVLVIYKDGKLIYSHAVNDMSRRQKLIGKFIAKRKGIDPNEALQDFTSSTKERIASCSKWLSAALVMTFVDEGKLGLEDTVGKYLPIMTAHGKGNIKIWQCLSHLTGIKTGNLKESREIVNNANTMDGAIEGLASLPMEGEPGKTFHYSNAGLQIAAAVIEKISGKDFKTLFAERIAIPCNMPDTDFGNERVPLPAGGAWSTAEDYIHFLGMILDEGKFNGKQILSKASIIEMQKNRVATNAVIAYTPAEAGNWGYGFGEWVMDDITAEKRSDAITSPGLFGSFPWIDNQKKYAGFLLTFNLKSKGRKERYTTLKHLVDEAIAQ